MTPNQKNDLGQAWLDLKDAVFEKIEPPLNYVAEHLDTVLTRLNDWLSR